MLTTMSTSVNSKRCGTSASRSFGPMSGSSSIIANTRSMTSRNSCGDRNSADTGAAYLRLVCSPAVADGTLHLHPTAPLAPRALLPGDPGRALALAQALFDEPARMFNHNRGLWGYTGTALDGEELTVQATGLGGPSAAIVLEELCDLGLRRAVRVGTCAALDGGAALGELVAVRGVVAGGGARRALGAGERVGGDDALTAALAARADRFGLVASADLFYDPRPERRAAWAAAGAVAVDLETAAVLTVARRRGIRAASLLAVTASGTERLGEGAGADARGRVRPGPPGGLGGARSAGARAPPRWAGTGPARRAAPP